MVFNFRNGRGKLFAAVMVGIFCSTSIALLPLHNASAQEVEKKSSQGKKTKHVASHHKGKHARRHTHLIYARPQPASYIVDADSGTVLESENADAPRYPASLTKMMTLYLTFEALNNHTLSFDQMLPVTAYAASQPQTNIDLQPGDRIRVRDAVLSIVVRSANDSAVTLGEALGGTEANFAEKMTRKAHALGMNNTVFYNASGLPQPLQHTTAKDMATLGMALRKNYPQYFSLFKTESFSFRGLTYVTHNHVMTRYEGVDGIKTGYIRASGFNLVTSANRYGHKLIAVVLGGRTSRERDDKMIGLLDNTFTQLASRDQGKTITLASARGERVMAKSENADEVLEGEGDFQGNVVRHTAFQSSASAGNWGIQIGVYQRLSDANTAASKAIKRAPGELNASSVSVSDATNPAAVHRARLINLTQNQAESACQKIAASRQPCFVYRID